MEPEKLKKIPARKTRLPKIAEHEAAHTSESAWVMIFLKKAGMYLWALSAFLLALKALEVALERLGLLDPSVVATDKSTLPLIGIVGLGLAFICNILPALRRRYELNRRPVGKGAVDYFDTAPRDKDPYGLFEKGYESIHDWISNSKSPLLFLTGLSGSGKSSVINAFIKPMLAAEESSKRSSVIVLRSYTEPLTNLKETLNGFRQRKGTEGIDIDPLTALGRTARLLQGERLLVVFDQFEEFFLLRTQLIPMTHTHQNSSMVPTLGVSEEELAPLRDFFKAFLASPPKGVTILLSYRQDYHRLLAPLELPAREERYNWMSLEPLDFATAASFLRSCPGLKVPENRMERILAEAARQEGGRVVMRPIVANLLGLILRRMSDHPTLWKRSGNLLRKYVYDVIHGELEKERVGVLRGLLTDFHTARPRTVAEIAREAHLDYATLEAQLQHLGQAGLVRCINAAEPDAARRVWQISHDFIATLIELVLLGIRRNIWRTIRPWLAPTAIVLLFLAWIISPHMQRQRTIDILEREGFSWSPNDLTISVVSEGRRAHDLNSLSSSLGALKPQTIDLDECSLLSDLDGLEGLGNLQALSLRSCGSLVNIDALANLVSIQSLDLRYCISLRNIDGLKDLRALKTLNLTFCDKVTNFSALSGLSQIEDLNLSGCKGFTTSNSLKGMPRLEHLDLSDCASLQDIDGVKELKNLVWIDLRACFLLKNIAGLRSHESLKDINLSHCEGIEDISALSSLPSLERLNLTGCNIPNTSELRTLSRLEKVSFSYCHTLTNIDDLRFLTFLTDLDFSHCEALKNIDVLKTLTGLKYINLTGCDQISKDEVNTLRSKLPGAQIIN